MGAEPFEQTRAYREGVSLMSTGLSTATTSGAKLVNTSASESGNSTTAPYKQLRKAAE